MVAELTPRSQEDAAAFRRRIQARNAANVLWSKPGIRKEYSERMKQFWQDPEKDFPGKVSALNQDPELRAKRSVTTTELWRNDSGFREKMLEARNDPKYKADQSEWQGGIRLEAFGLLLRGGTNEEIAQITGRKSKHIKNLRFRLRETGELPKPTQEEVWLARSKANKGKPRGSHGRVFSLDKQYLMKLAGALSDRGFYQEDLQYKDTLVRIYNEAKRNLPEEFEVQLILEAYTKALLSSDVDTDMQEVVQKLEHLASSERFEDVSTELLFVEKRAKGAIRRAIRTVRDNEPITRYMFEKYLLQDERGDIILPSRNSQQQYNHTQDTARSGISIAEFLYCCPNCRSFIPVIYPNTHGRDIIERNIQRIYPPKGDGSCSHPAEIRLKHKKPVAIKDGHREGYHWDTNRKAE